MTATNFYCDQLKPLIGATIAGTFAEGEYFGLLLTLPDGTKKSLVILSDDEGNGPGSFDIQPLRS